MTDVVHRSIVVPNDAADVWAALTHRERLRLWFGAEVDLQPWSGGDVRASWPDGARSVGSVELAEEPVRLVFRWRRIDGVGFGSSVGGATRVSFGLVAVEGGTRVVVTEQPVELASVVGAP